MTWAKLIRKNLLRRPMRTALTAAGVSIGVGLIVALLSITAGVRNTANQLIHLGRADFGLFQSGTSDLTKSILPQSLEAGIAKQPGVQMVASLQLYITDVNDQSSFLVLGMQPGQFPWQRLVIVHGRLPVDGQVVVGDSALKALHTEVGGKIAIGKRTFPVSGIYHTGDPFEDNGVVMRLSELQKLTNRPKEVTTIAITVVPGARSVLSSSHSGT